MRKKEQPNKDFKALFARVKKQLKAEELIISYVNKNGKGECLAESSVPFSLMTAKKLAVSCLEE